MRKRIAIIGAGPAGLTAAYILGKANQDVIVFEKDENYVGGISRTESYKGFHFDIGGHRFFSKSAEINDLWNEILPNEMLECKRISRIYYKNRFFSYPLKAFDVLRNLGLKESTLCILSYIKAKIVPVKNPVNFEEWVTNQFGKRLFRVFFKTYTEKVWGIPCSQISADWAAQRIKGLSLSSAILNSIYQPKKSGNNDLIKTLIDTFRYPIKGPGMLWERCAEKCVNFGVKIEMGGGIEKIEKSGAFWNVHTLDKQWNGFDFVLSSAPIKELIPAVEPLFSQSVIDAASKLSYRDFIVVVLICKDKDAFLDNWIYIHEPNVQVGRIQNYKSWSTEMVPDQKLSCYGLEYFCFENDGLWSEKDEDLIKLGKTEICKIGLIKPESIIDGYVVRQSKAYPVYDKNYKEHVNVIRDALKNITGLYLIGRNGMHKYNNQDHSMMTAILAAKNILAGYEKYDLWDVNEDAEYHEGGEAKSKTNSKGRLVPQKIESEDLNQPSKER